MRTKKSKSYNIFSCELVKKDGKVIHKDATEKKLYQEFKNSIEEGQKVTMFIEAHNDDGFFSQLAKIHACIREISSEMGQSFQDSKKMIKEMSGLYFEVGNTFYEKSFGNCSVAELTLAIQAIIEAGDAIGINFRGEFPQYHQA